MLSPRYHHLLLVSLSVSLVCLVPSYAKGGGGHAPRAGGARSEERSEVQQEHGNVNGGAHGNGQHSLGTSAFSGGSQGRQSNKQVNYSRNQLVHEYNWGPSKSGSTSGSGSASGSTGSSGIKTSWSGSGSGSVNGSGSGSGSGSKVGSSSGSGSGSGSASGTGSSSGSGSKAGAGTNGITASSTSPGTGNGVTPIGQVTGGSTWSPPAQPQAVYVAPATSTSNLTSNRYALNSLGTNPLGITPPAPTVIPSLGGQTNGTSPIGGTGTEN
jgi:hypothetical protein